MAIEENVVEFFGALFERMFTKAFSPKLRNTLKRRAVERQIEEAADAASQSLTRLFVNQGINQKAVQNTLRACKAVLAKVVIDDISSANLTPESFIQDILQATSTSTKRTFPEDPVSRVALHSVVQVLMLVAPVMGEWRKLEFSSQFELPRRVVNRLNEISQQLSALGAGGTDAGDDAFELTYRDYLMQRFHRVEAGTVRMTTNLAVDLQSLFVMAKLSDPPKGGKNADAFMGLAQAREILQDKHEAGKTGGLLSDALEEIRKHSRCVIVGTPGGGKSTLLEWLQLQLAAVREQLIMGVGQAIPILIRVRTLDPTALPTGNALIEKATGSSDQAAMCPAGWVDRMLDSGRVFLMVDGLDEVDPDLRDRFVLPWLENLCRDYPSCRYLVSSRPAGYVAGALMKLEFVEKTLCDFDEEDVAAFAEHWCTAVRLARNERDEEAQREGSKDGAAIVAGFKHNPYVRNLARNPLMLSAICLVHYFEGGELPRDRAILYRLCVEGLLHHWDQRRGIRSEFGLDEKLRVCREVALAMQSSDRAEFEEARVLSVLSNALGDTNRAEKLLAHIRHRTGLLLERRANVYAFAHLTFQEYLSAVALNAGNLKQLQPKHVVRSHGDGRWQEVLALYSAIASAKDVRILLNSLIRLQDSAKLSLVLGEAFLAARPEVTSDAVLREKVIRRLVQCSGNRMLERFSDPIVPGIANELFGTGEARHRASEAYWWLSDHPGEINWPLVTGKISGSAALGPQGLGELMYLVHCLGPDAVMLNSDLTSIYLAPGPRFSTGAGYPCQAWLALLALSSRTAWGQGASQAFLSVLQVFVERPQLLGDARLRNNAWDAPIPTIVRLQGAELMQKLAESLKRDQRTDWLDAASILRGDMKTKAHAV